MDAANHSEFSPLLRVDAHPNPASPERAAASVGLADEIDRLRQVMAETFLRECSFTADTVIRISRQLDVKINEYMIGRKKAR
ncbi:aspartyl-phosphate phosphatase Spo0E family protein [Cohnella pontilimi]|uniref:Aspartyl-phosphate phosphatase Spo0E family protein n=1 Tax=Cohnella pontilimi TaxID=2564100 RepID=A0A4U0F8R0_9BACL|nr:aspartyl-phosphate phosphatase Spo0E family protein [Cohnella pontilimi]TJY41021.1 aspartyl-phosphate phosphatase Spo0E family protein [Cohnella pontilimi]